MTPRVLVLASHNEKKVKELQAILQDLPFEVQCLKTIAGAPQVNEDGETFEANAVKKAVTIARWSQKLTLADDSGLCVDALGGAPGVYSARFAGESQDELANCEKLLNLMKEIPEGLRGASFHCVIAVAGPHAGILGVAKGEYRGSIAFGLKGRHGFGYDPVFVDPASGKRFAELPPDIKNKISHRAQALAEAKKLLRSYLKSSEMGLLKKRY